MEKEIRQLFLTYGKILQHIFQVIKAQTQLAKNIHAAKNTIVRLLDN